MIVTVSGLSGLRNAYVSVLSAEGSSEINGASRWLDAWAAEGLPPRDASAAMSAAEAAAARRTNASLRIVLSLLSDGRLDVCGLSWPSRRRCFARRGESVRASAARDDLDRVPVCENVLSSDALAFEACGRAPHMGAAATSLELVMNGARDLHDGRRRTERDRVRLVLPLAAEEDPHQTCQPPDRRAERVETAVVEHGDCDDLEIGECRRDALESVRRSFVELRRTLSSASRRHSPISRSSQSPCSTTAVSTRSARRSGG